VTQHQLVWHVICYSELALLSPKRETIRLFILQPQKHKVSMSGL